MHLLQHLLNWLLLLQTISTCLANSTTSADAETEADTTTKIDKNGIQPTMELPKPLLSFRKQKGIINFTDDYNTDEDDDDDDHENDEKVLEIAIEDSTNSERRGRSHRRTLMDIALQESAREGLDAMAELYRKIVPDIIRNGQLLADNHPAALLSKFSAPLEDTEGREMAAYAAITATKAFKKNYKHINVLARQAHTPKISLRRTALEGLCPPRDVPTCMPASERYRTHDGTCNNKRRLRWGATQMPFNRYLPPEYGDGVDTIRNSVEGGALSSSRFVSLLVHGAKDGEAPLTLMTAQWGQLLDHDMTSTAQPRSINGSVPSCCGSKDFHPSCFPIKVPLDDPWLAPLKVRCLEFLRSAPAQRRDCVLSWREQTNQATSYIDASPIYSSSAKSSDNARVFHNGLLVFGRGSPAEDVCQRGAIARQCIRAGDGRSGEQPGLLALHHVWVGEHNLIAMEISEMNPHWSDEKVYQETRRIIGAMFQHITYREFLPIILGREVCKLFDLNLMTSGYYEGYDPKANPTVANSFAAAAFRFGHSLVQNSYMRCDRHHNVLSNNVSLHEEFQRGDIGSAGSLHRLLRGMATQRVLKRDEFITPELTNHLFQTPGFPFGLDLAAINIQRGRDHGIAPYTSWRVPCGLTPINNWDDFSNVVGDESARRISHAYRSVHDIDLFVGGISERPVVGGLVGPTFACIIAQQFSNSRKGDRFWYENIGFESSFTPAQLHSIRRVSLAQVLCRAVGGGTFQPHIFIPHDLPENKRVPCGTGPLTPIDLGPWLEHDPFSESLSRPTFETPVPDRIFDIVPTELNTNTIQILKEDKAGNRVRPVHNVSLSLQHKPHIDFIPNSSFGFQRPTLTNVNDKINDKLDFKRKGPSSTKRPTKRPVQGINNKLDKGGTKITLNIKHVNRRRPQAQTTTRRTVIVNNVPIELRSAAAKVTNTNAKIEQNVDITGETQTKTKRKTTNNVKKINVLKARADDIGTADSEKQISTSTEIAVNDINDEEHIAEEDIFDIFSTLTEPPTESKQIEHLLDKLESRTVDNDLSSLEKNKTTMKNSTNTGNKISQIKIKNHTLVDKKGRLTLPDNAILSSKENETVTNMETTMTKHLDKKTQTNHHLIEHKSDSPENQYKTETRAHAFAPIASIVAEIETNKYQRNLQDNETDLKTLDNTYINSTTLRKTSNHVFRTKDQTKLQDSDIDPMTHSTATDHKRVQRNFDLTESISLSRIVRSPNLGFAHRYKNTKTNTTTIYRTTLATPRTNKNLTVTTRIPKITKVANAQSVELRQYQSRPLYTRPQKVIVDGPNSDQYEIEINIRQTNKSPAAKPGSNYAEYTTAYRPYGYDRYSNNANSNYADYTSTTPIYAYYQPPPSTAATFAQIQRTKPPTVIYINEHDEQTTTRLPGLLHNFLSFATSGFGGHRNPISQSNAQKDKPVYSTNRVPSNGLTSNVISRPHSVISTPQYNPDQQQLQSPLISSSFSQVGSYPDNSVAHASSSAVSNGHFGSITGVANANGADSTFSFNIRPRPAATAVLVSTKPTSDSYGLLPPRRPPVSQSSTPQYITLPVAYPTNDQYYPESPNREELNSPFSIGYKKPPEHHAYDYLSRTQVTAQKKDTLNPPDHKLDIRDYDYLSRTLETNNTSREISESDSDEKDDYTYNDADDDDENEKSSAKFDRDGYLRPEHMLETLFKNQDPLPTNLTRNITISLLDDNFVLPVLNNSTQTLTDVPTPIETATTSSDITSTDTEITTNYPDAQEKHLNNDLLAEDYDENTTDKFIVSKTAALTAITSKNQHKAPQNLAFAPIKVLTKPERPDNWVIYEAPVEKHLLPEQPILNTETFTAAEFPMPFTSLNNVWLTKYRNKLTEKSNKDILAKHSFTDISNKTIQNNENTERPDSTEDTLQRRDISESTERTENTQSIERADSTNNTNSTENTDNRQSTVKRANTNSTESADTTTTTDSTEWTEITGGIENADSTESTESTEITDSENRTESMNITVSSVMTNRTEDNERLQTGNNTITDVTHTDTHLDTTLAAITEINETNSTDTMTIDKKLLKTKD